MFSFLSATFQIRKKIGDKVALNNYSEIIVDKNMATNIAGVYAAGDSIAKRYRQVTTAVADGTIAALSASEYVNNIKKEMLTWSLQTKSPSQPFPKGRTFF